MKHFHCFHTPTYTSSHPKKHSSNHTCKRSPPHTLHGLPQLAERGRSLGHARGFLHLAVNVIYSLSAPRWEVHCGRSGRLPGVGDARADQLYWNQPAIILHTSCAVGPNPALEESSVPFRKSWWRDLGTVPLPQVGCKGRQGEGWAKSQKQLLVCRMPRCPSGRGDAGRGLTEVGPRLWPHEETLQDATGCPSV